MRSFFFNDFFRLYSSNLLKSYEKSQLPSLFSQIHDLPNHSCNKDIIKSLSPFLYLWTHHQITPILNGYVTYLLRQKHSSLSSLYIHQCSVIDEKVKKNLCTRPFVSGLETSSLEKLNGVYHYGKLWESLGFCDLVLKQYQHLPIDISMYQLSTLYLGNFIRDKNVYPTEQIIYVNQKLFEEEKKIREYIQDDKDANKLLE